MSDLGNTIRTSTRLTGAWVVSVPIIARGLLGAVLYGLLGIFSYALPTNDLVTIRPAIAILVFFGIRFGPWAGLIAGALGNPLIDLLQGDGFLTHWPWSIANGLIGLLAGLIAYYVREPAGSRARVIRLVGISVIAVMIGLLFTAIDVLLGDSGSHWWGRAYLPAALWSALAAGVLVPVLDSGWRPHRAAAGEAPAGR